MLACATFILGAAAFAQGPAPSPLISLPSPPPANVPAASADEPGAGLTKQDFETFLDALIPSELRTRNIAGAVVSVVKDGQVLLQKGYGYADFEAKKPVIPDQTLFRPGSISKLFTATAVMQLVEQGKLDLDRDVNDYLDFAIPKTYPEPITLRRLLTHTAGFEETLKNLFVARESDMKPLGTYLVNQMPARIFPPGKIPSYSNYGFTLAGYIVERVSGEKFERYIDNHILKPLKMNNSTFDQPLAAAARASNVERLSQRSRKTARFRICGSCTRRCAFNHRRRHDALHARVSARRQRRRCFDPETGNRAANANSPV